MVAGERHVFAELPHEFAVTGAEAPSVAARLKPLGIVPEYAPPAKLVDEMREEHQRVSELARQAGLVK